MMLLDWLKIKDAKHHYSEWLKWYIAKGGRVTHTYSYPLAQHRWVIAKKDGKYLGGAGAKSYHLLIPEGVTGVELIDPQHCPVYSYEERHENVSFVPQYSDCLYDPDQAKKHRDDQELHRIVSRFDLYDLYFKEASDGKLFCDDSRLKKLVALIKNPLVSEEFILKTIETELGEMPNSMCLYEAFSWRRKMLMDSGCFDNP